LKIIIGGLITAIIISLLGLLFFSILFPKNLDIPVSTPEFLTIPAATLTPSDQPAFKSTVKPSTNSKFQLGMYVQIGGTGNGGLRFHSSPSLNSETLFVGMDNEVLKVMDGPKQSDGHVWWYLTAPYDQNRSGWAVEDFLIVFNTPSP